MRDEVKMEGGMRALAPPGGPVRLRLLVWMVAAVCALTMGFLASVSLSSAFNGDSTTIAWWSNDQLAQSVKFLQQAPVRSASHASNTSTVAHTSAPEEEAVNTTSNNEKGVIMCLHDGIAAMGASLIRELRCLGNNEPIQVYHCFPDELSPQSRELLTYSDPNVEIVDVCSAYLNDAKVFGGNRKKAQGFKSYWIKPLALIHTRLQEVILMDADAILLRNPSELRVSNSGYNRTGTIFFHDRIHKLQRFFNKPMKDGEQMLKRILKTFDYKKFGLPQHTPSPYLMESFAYKQESGHEMDSSLVFIDKRRAGKAIDVLLYLILTVRHKYAFSWGDKEAFWLAYELAQQEYFFSPWGLSLINSVPSNDLVDHPKTLCGSMAHFDPVEDEAMAPEVLYVNGKALLDPFSVAIEKMSSVAPSRLFNTNPTHVTPRYRYSTFDLSTRKTFECMDDLGSTLLPDDFKVKLLRRRHHYFAAVTGVLAGLQRCDV